MYYWYIKHLVNTLHKRAGSHLLLTCVDSTFGDLFSIIFYWLPCCLVIVGGKFKKEEPHRFQNDSFNASQCNITILKHVKTSQIFNEVITLKELCQVSFLWLFPTVDELLLHLVLPVSYSC